VVVEVVWMEVEAWVVVVRPYARLCVTMALMHATSSARGRETARGRTAAAGCPDAHGGDGQAYVRR